MLRRTFVFFVLHSKFWAARLMSGGVKPNEPQVQCLCHVEQLKDIEEKRELTVDFEAYRILIVFIEIRNMKQKIKDIDFNIFLS